MWTSKSTLFIWIRNLNSSPWEFSIVPVNKWLEKSLHVNKLEFISSSISQVTPLHAHTIFALGPNYLPIGVS